LREEGKEKEKGTRGWGKRQRIYGQRKFEWAREDSFARWSTEHHVI